MQLKIRNIVHHLGSRDMDLQLQAAIQLLKLSTSLDNSEASAASSFVDMFGLQCTAQLQGLVLDILSLLSVNNDNKVLVASAGAIPFLVALLGPHSSSDVQRSAAYVLCNISLENDNNKVLVASAGAIPSLVALLGPHSSADVQEPSVNLLWVLSENNDNKILIAAAGAIPFLVALLGPHSSSNVQRSAASALNSLSVGNDDNNVLPTPCGTIRSTFLN